MYRLTPRLHSRSAYESSAQMRRLWFRPTAADRSHIATEVHSYGPCSVVPQAPGAVHSTSKGRGRVRNDPVEGTNTASYFDRVFLSSKRKTCSKGQTNWRRKRIGSTLSKTPRHPPPPHFCFAPLPNPQNATPHLHPLFYTPWSVCSTEMTPGSL